MGGVGGEGIDHGGCKIGWGFFQIRTVVEVRGLCVECMKAICKREWNAKRSLYGVGRGKDRDQRRIRA